MATGQTIVDAIAASDAVLADDTINLAAINYCLGTLWPQWRLTERKDGGTFASGDFDYDLSALTNIDQDVGIANVFVTPNSSSEPLEIGHRCKQYYDLDIPGWTLQVRPSIVSTFVGKTFEVTYQYPHPMLTALTDTVYAPVQTIVAMATNALLFYAMRGATVQNIDNTFWRAFAPEYFTSGEPIYQRISSRHLPMKVTVI